MAKCTALAHDKQDVDNERKQQQQHRDEKHGIINRAVRLNGEGRQHESQNGSRQSGPEKILFLPGNFIGDVGAVNGDVASMLRKNTIILLSIDIHDSSTFYIGNGNRPFLRGL